VTDDPRRDRFVSPPVRAPRRSAHRRRCGATAAVLVTLVACSDAPGPQHLSVASSPIDATRATPVTRANFGAPTTHPGARSTLAPAAQPAPGALALVGTAVTPRGSFAILRREGTPEFMLVRVGDAIDRRVVTELDFDRIVLAAPGDTGDTTLHLAPGRSAVEIAASAAIHSQGIRAAGAPAARTPSIEPAAYIEPEIVIAGH
jgi:hypothetical protein